MLRNSPHRGERFWLGLFDEEIEAARAYDHAAVQHRGEFARVNLPEEWPPERCAAVHAEYLRTGQSSFALASMGKRAPKRKKAGSNEGKNTPAAKVRGTSSKRRATKKGKQFRRATEHGSRATSSRPRTPEKEDRNERPVSRKERKKAKKGGEKRGSKV